MAEADDFDDLTQRYLNGEPLHELTNEGQARELEKAAGISKRTTKKILTQEKRRRALELRKAGMPYHKIAATLGLNSGQQAAAMVRAEIKDIPKEASREFVDVERERLNHMLMLLWRTVNNPADPGHYQAIDRALRIMDKLEALEGVGGYAEKAPVNVNVGAGVIQIGGSEREYLEGMRKLANQAMAALPQPETPVETTVSEDIVDAELVEDEIQTEDVG